MDLDLFVQTVNSWAPAPVLIVLGLLGTGVVLGTSYVALTPNKKDDKLLAKIEAIAWVNILLQVLKSFSLIKKEDDKIKLAGK